MGFLKVTLSFIPGLSFHLPSQGGTRISSFTAVYSQLHCEAGHTEKGTGTKFTQFCDPAQTWTQAETARVIHPSALSSIRSITAQLSRQERHQKARRGNAGETLVPPLGFCLCPEPPACESRALALFLAVHQSLAAALPWPETVAKVGNSPRAKHLLHPEPEDPVERHRDPSSSSCF